MAAAQIITNIMATTHKPQAVQEPAAQPMADDQATSDTTASTSDVQSSGDDMPELPLIPGVAMPLTNPHAVVTSELLPTLTPRQQVISMLVAGYISGMVARTKPYTCDVLDPIHLIGLAAPVADAILDQS